MRTEIKSAIPAFALPKTDPNANMIRFLDAEAGPTARGEYWIYAAS